MESTTIICNRCNQLLSHVCNKDFAKAWARLQELTTEGLDNGIIRAMRSSPYYAAGDENAPIFSEKFLYSLMGKEEARTILAVLDNLVRAAGIEPSRMLRELAKDKRRAHFPHDCWACQFQGSFTMDSGEVYDLYRCDSTDRKLRPDGPSYVARNGQEPHEYWSIPYRELLSLEEGKRVLGALSIEVLKRARKIEEHYESARRRRENSRQTEPG